jgi:hypothetical protein
MRNRKAKWLLAAGLSGLLVVQAGCIGNFRLFNNVLDWNHKLSNRWVNELVFVAFHVIPVYPFALMGDLFIFNAFDFWGTSNPISSTAEGADDVAATRTFQAGEHKVVLERSDTEMGRQLTVRTYRNDELVQRSDLVARADGTIAKVDPAGNVLAVAQPGPDGSLLVRDALTGETRLVTAASAARSLP